MAMLFGILAICCLIYYGVILMYSGIGTSLSVIWLILAAVFAVMGIVTHVYGLVRHRVPIRLEVKLTGIPLFQFLPVGGGQAGEPTGDSSFPGIGDDGIQGGLQVISQGEKVNTFPVELAKKCQVVFVQGGFLPSPQK